MSDFWRGYRADGGYDELFAADGRPRPFGAALVAQMEALGRDELAARRIAADLSIKGMGITFTVYAEGGAIDRAWPFDILPRIIPEREWRTVRTGLVQRLDALNRFIQDVYNERHIVRDGVVPEALLAESRNFRPECRGMTPPGGIWAHICGSDLVRDDSGRFLVLEDNLRVPSGVSYMVENRLVSKRVFPEVFAAQSILPVDDYPGELLDALSALAPRHDPAPHIALLTPGVYNSAYFEHVWLAGQMGAELVQGGDLTADNDGVFARTIYGPKRVDVIYRRVDDAFLDPTVFRRDSLLGVPGLMKAWRRGQVVLANAPGAGVADDKLVYTYVPDMIRYYLDQEPILSNVPSYRCVDDKEREHVLTHLDKLVVKPVNESGGYGLLIGPAATAAERERCAAHLRARPRDYIAQPTLNLSTAPTLVDDVPVPRHVDLRPFAIARPDGDGYATMGGLTRVALREGSLVVNSSQGGGSKDTWVVEEPE